MATPRDRAKVHDTIVIGDVETPGICELASPVSRETKYDVQSQPGYIGKIPVPSGQELITVTYRFIMWTDEHFADWEKLRIRIEKARKAKPRPEAITISDPRLDGMNATKFLVQGFTSQEYLGEGRWQRTATFIEYGVRVKIPTLPANKDVQDKAAKDAADAEAARKAAEDAAKAEADRLREAAEPVMTEMTAGFSEG